MQILKVLNNNVVHANGENDQEMVVMGRGVGFQTKTGDDVDTDKIEKVFVLQSTDSNFAEIFQEVPASEMDVIYKILDVAEKELGQSFQANLLITLADHLHFAIERTVRGEALTNPLAWNIKRLYKTEYQIGLKALNLIKDEIGVQLAPSEAASIALHLINAQKEGSLVGETVKMVKVVEDIIRIVELNYGTKFDEESISFNRFLTHLQYFAQRIHDGKVYAGKDDSFLYEQVQKNYPAAFACSEKIKAYVEATHGYPMGKEEQVYLTIHIQRAAEK